MGITPELMAQNTEIQRVAIKRVYVSKEWAKKVDGMAADQVTAIYLRLKSENKLR